MVKIISFLIVSFIFLSSPVSAPVFGDDFSCPFGRRGACLDYNDKVCSMFSKCVGQNDICFDSFTCNYKGFVCKSKFDDIIDEYNNLLGKYKIIASENDDLVNKFNELIRKYKNLESDYESLDDCVSNATTLYEAKLCK